MEHYSVQFVDLDQLDPSQQN